VDSGSDLLTLFLLFEEGGSSILKLTSGGNERVAPPTREAHGTDVENARGPFGQQNAGGETLATILLKNLGGSAAAGTAFASERASQ
jgi:hypothetical protein